MRYGHTLAALALAIIAAAPASAEWFRAQRSPASVVVYTLAGSAYPGTASPATTHATAAPMLAIECTAGEARLVVYWREPMAGYYGQMVRYSIDGAAHHATVVPEGRRIWVDVDGRTLVFEEPDPLAARQDRDDPSIVASPVAGLVRHVAVTVGDRIAAGQTVGVVEAMKMETTLVARAAGVVRVVRIVAGDQVGAGAIAAEIEVDADG